MKTFQIFILLSLFLGFQIPAESREKKKEALIKKQEDKDSIYSFRPLLIHGKRQFSKRSEDMKVQGKSIVESEMFSVDIDFKKRIFSGFEK